MRLLVSWLRDFVDIGAPAEEIAERMGLRGFEVATIERFGSSDGVIDFEVTANRPDCLSVLGLAREVATIYGLPIRLPSMALDARVQLSKLPVGDSDRLAVTIEDPDACPRYAAATMDVTVSTSPAWLTARLQAAGIRPISTVVDVTNYVLIELGHPTHAFDMTKLGGPEIRVRRAKPGETIVTLDGVQRKLDAEMLVIADRDRAQAIAGVMGGAGSEVSSATTRVVLESAYFRPSSVRRTSKRLNLKTEASARFERGADLEAPIVAIQRIAALMEQIGAGRVAGPIVDRYPERREPRSIRLRRERLDALLGISISDADVVRILTSLSLDVTTTHGGWDTRIPSFRVDLLREVDLIEEVGRHDGFEKLPATFPVVTAPAAPPDARIARDQLVRRVLTAAGLTEAVTFGFIEARAAEPFAGPSGPAVALANPLSAKFDTMRPSLVPGLIDAVAHNRRHGREDVRLFEIGTRFAADGETRAVALACAGNGAPVHWSNPPREVDFFDISGIVALLADTLETPIRFEPAAEPFLEPGRSAAIIGTAGASTNVRVGTAGQIAAAIADARGLSRHDRVYVAELNLDQLAHGRAPRPEEIQSLPRHPFVVRDLSIVVSNALPAAIIRGTIQTAGREGPAPLAAVRFFDRYQGKGVPEGSISISVRLTFQANDRTLTDAEVQQSVDTIMAALARDHRAVQR
jgi:phenylalanyl-tRNA synthetase beta chain